MEHFTPIINDEYKKYAALLSRHHDLLCALIEDGEEIESIEDEMTVLWDRLDSVQRASLSGLGSDQNWIRRNGEPAPRGKKREDVTPEDKEALERSMNANDWHAVLHYIRVCRSWLPNDYLANIRSIAWIKIGLPEIANPFMEFASKLKLNDISVGSPDGRTINPK